MPKFSSQHYNAIAKDIREEISLIDSNAHSNQIWGRRDHLAQRGAVVNLAIRFAKRFEEDNERFDPLKFLDACSPNVDLYPLSELWEV